MKLRVLGISASPRENGNTDLLLREALAGAESAGACSEYVSLRDKRISPCLAEQSCFENGKCRIADDFQVVLEKMLAADRLIFATPVFFMTVPAQFKLLIDRCQCLWARKYVLGKPLFADRQRDRPAMVISVGGSRGKLMFDCIGQTMYYFLDVLEARFALYLYGSELDARGAVADCGASLKQAYQSGRELVLSRKVRPRQPRRIQL